MDVPIDVEGPCWINNSRIFCLLTLVIPTEGDSFKEVPFRLFPTYGHKAVGGTDGVEYELLNNQKHSNFFQLHPPASSSRALLVIGLAK